MSGREITSPPGGTDALFDPLVTVDVSVFELRPLFTGILFGAFGIDTRSKAEKISSTYRAARRFLAPLMVKTALDMLPALQAAVADDPDTRIVFAGRDSFTLGYVVSIIDSEFHQAHCRNLYLTRSIIDAAMTDLERAGRRFPAVEGFRKRSPEPPGTPAWQELRRYLALNELDLDGATGRVILVDTGYKGSIQEMLAAAYPDVRFHGLYVFHAASGDDPHPGSKRGYILHLDAEAGHGGRALRGALPEDPALTFAHHEAIVAVEELLQGSQLSPRRLDPAGRPRLLRARRSENHFEGLSPARISAEFCGAAFREAVLSFNVVSVSNLARVIAEKFDARAPGWHSSVQHTDWYAELVDGVEALRTQLRMWISPDVGSRVGIDPELLAMLDSFVHRTDQHLVHELDALLLRADIHPDRQGWAWQEFDRCGSTEAKQRFVEEQAQRPVSSRTDFATGPQPLPLLRQRGRAVDALRAVAPELPLLDANRIAALAGDDTTALAIIGATLVRTGMPVPNYIQLFKARTESMIAEGAKVVAALPVLVATDLDSPPPDTD
jgi:hypothetical protein